MSRLWTPNLYVICQVYTLHMTPSHECRIRPYDRDNTVIWQPMSYDSIISVRWSNTAEDVIWHRYTRYIPSISNFPGILDAATPGPSASRGNGLGRLGLRVGVQTVTQTDEPELPSRGRRAAVVRHVQVEPCNVCFPHNFSVLHHSSMETSWFSLTKHESPFTEEKSMRSSSDTPVSMSLLLFWRRSASALSKKIL